MKEISVQELKDKIENGEAPILIDIRETYEFDQANIGGQNLPMGQIPVWKDQFRNDMTNEIVICCNTGNRSKMAVSFLEAQGFTNVKNLTGGVVAYKALENK